MWYAEEMAVPYVAQRVRFMKRFFEEVVEADPKTGAVMPELNSAYQHILNEEVASYVLDVALAVVKLKDRAKRWKKRTRAARRKTAEPRTRRGGASAAADEEA